ncbi:hypothetical protein ACOME3_002785 [Neoechinorhynchus agilis]
MSKKSISYNRKILIDPEKKKKRDAELKAFSSAYSAKDNPSKTDVAVKRIALLEERQKLFHRNANCFIEALIKSCKLELELESAENNWTELINAVEETRKRNLTSDFLNQQKVDLLDCDDSKSGIETIDCIDLIKAYVTKRSLVESGYNVATVDCKNVKFEKHWEDNFDPTKSGVMNVDCHFDNKTNNNKPNSIDMESNVKTVDCIDYAIRNFNSVRNGVSDPTKSGVMNVDCHFDNKTNNNEPDSIDMESDVETVDCIDYAIRTFNSVRNGISDPIKSGVINVDCHFDNKTNNNEPDSIDMESNVETVDCIDYAIKTFNSVRNGISDVLNSADNDILRNR